jgi:hypothetical protein
MRDKEQVSAEYMKLRKQYVYILIAPRKWQDEKIKELCETRDFSHIIKLTRQSKFVAAPAMISGVIAHIYLRD